MLAKDLDLGWQAGVDFSSILGETAASERQKIAHIFNDAATPLHLLLVSTKAAALGINLVGASRVVLFDVSWNPATDAQALHRAYRYGQTRSVFVYRLVAAETMEEKIYTRQVQKQALAREVVDDESIAQMFKQEDLGKLFAPETAKAMPADAECGTRGVPVRLRPIKASQYIF